MFLRVKVHIGVEIESGAGTHPTGDDSLAYALQADPILSGEKFYVSDAAGDTDGGRVPSARIVTIW